MKASMSNRNMDFSRRHAMKGSMSFPSYNSVGRRYAMKASISHRVMTVSVGGML